MGRRRDQQWRNQPLRRQKAAFSEIFRVLRPGGHLQFADIANGKPVPEAAIQNITLGQLELPVVCRVQPGKKCWKTSGSLKFGSGRRLTPFRVRAAKRTPVVLRSMDIRSWHANRNELNFIEMGRDLQGFFEATEMPSAGWWEDLWPDPADVIGRSGSSRHGSD